jgi:transcriptional regulator with XRE-family HTH domain
MLGEELRKARLKAELTQEELAFKGEISRQYVSLLELNEKSPTVDTLLRICRAMDASASKIISKIEMGGGNNNHLQS